MSTSDRQGRRSPHRRMALRIAVFYIVFSGLWIHFSDVLFAWHFSTPVQLAQGQTIKEWFIVAVTAGLLYFYLSYSLRGSYCCEDAPGVEGGNLQLNTHDHFIQLDTLFGSVNAVVYVADFSTHELLYVSPYAMELFGRDWQERKCYHYLQKGIDQPCDFCTNAQLVVDGEPGDPVTWEFLNTRNKCWYECFDKAIRWTDGQLVRLELALDITERKKREKIREELLSSVSHEMRTPLTAISGFSELLLNEPNVQEQHRRHIEIIYNEAEKLTELIGRFLDVRHLKISQARISYESLPIRILLEKAKNLCRDCEAHHDIQIECQEDLHIYGNGQELTQVITQLLDNACRYSPGGGTISLTAQTTGGKISIRVTDQGVGIPRPELESIFKPFHRLDPGDKRSTKGVGLGLFLAKTIVALHGGQIQVESTFGQGSTFTVLLPQPVKSNNAANINLTDTRES